MLELMEKASHREDDKMGGFRLRSGSWNEQNQGVAAVQLTSGLTW